MRGDDRGGEAQAGGERNSRWGQEAAGMDQFLAKPALIQRILGFERNLTGLLQGGGFVRYLGRGLRRRRMNVGLDNQALKKECQQRQNRHPLSG